MLLLLGITTDGVRGSEDVPVVLVEIPEGVEVKDPTIGVLDSFGVGVTRLVLGTIGDCVDEVAGTSVVEDTVGSTEVEVVAEGGELNDGVGRTEDEVVTDGTTLDDELGRTEDEDVTEGTSGEFVG